MVARAAEAARPLIDAEGHTLAVTPPPEPVWIDGDLVRLAQVVGNLLHNAAKYTERGGRIDLTGAREDGQAVVRVRDTGIGIAPQMLPRIFELFVQVDHAATKAQGGLGIDVARRLRQQPGLDNVVLAALTGWGQQEDRRRTAEAGFDHHLVKPPEPKAVESILAGLKHC